MIILIILVEFVILTKQYKLHVRENEVSIHVIVEEHYVRYIDEEVKYKKEKNVILQIGLCVNTCTRT